MSSSPALPVNLRTQHVNYLVNSVVGEGRYSKVIKCVRSQDNETVAIKMLSLKELGIIHNEVLNMVKLHVLDSDRCNIIQCYHTFSDEEQFYIVFEHLDRTLHDFMTARCLKPLPLKELRPIVSQLANALHHLSSIGLIHTDIKLDNVMLVDHAKEPYRVKLIDFGLASDVSDLPLGTLVQPIQYRAPEVILGLPITEAIDMWSLGCMTLTMYTGYLWYPSYDEYDTMRCIVETLGQPPDHLLSLGWKTEEYFVSDSTTYKWTLKTPEQHGKDEDILQLMSRRRMLSSLDSLLDTHLIDHGNYADKAAEMADVVMFVDLMKGMLQLDAKKRIKPHEVLVHPFVSMSHIAALNPLSPHVQSCFEIMKVCPDTRPADADEAVREEEEEEEEEEPTCGTTNPSQNPPPPVEKSSQSPHHRAKPDPSRSALKAKAGIKRKNVPKEDDCQLASDPKPKRFRQSIHLMQEQSDQSGHEQVERRAAHGHARKRPHRRRPRHDRKRAYDYGH